MIHDTNEKIIAEATEWIRTQPGPFYYLSPTSSYFHYSKEHEKVTVEKGKGYISSNGR